MKAAMGKEFRELLQDSEGRKLVWENMLKIIGPSEKKSVEMVVHNQKYRMSVVRLDSKEAR